MDFIEAALLLVRDFGLPIGLVVFGCWFLVVHAWPDFVATRIMFTEALTRFTEVLERVVEKLPDPRP